MHSGFVELPLEEVIVVVAAAAVAFEATHFVVDKFAVHPSIVVVAVVVEVVVASYMDISPPMSVAVSDTVKLDNY